ncbi:cysteine proteinase [Whalleya microplaca]|nr:cysteine proteinase [Whalleya microplaca]
MSVAYSAPPSESAYLDHDAGGRTVMAEMPVTLSRNHKRNKQQTPQEAIDEFWSKFTTKAPGKATTVIPQNEYAEKAARRSTKAVGTTTQASYEEAAAVCRAKVAKIVKECRRVNQKYRDPHFDLELDLKWGGRDTLESLCNSVKGHGGRPPPPPGPDSGFRPKSVKRVVDVFDEPRFYIDGPTANDVRQGRDGDCWLLAALCTLSNKPSLIERVCVARDEQVGVYGFVFHRDGEWISEIIDDKLFLTKPDFDESFLERMLWEDRERINSEEQYRKTYQSGSGALYFSQCEHANETWLPLLEKAYAKAHGDYAAIEGGFTGEGIEDLTGGVTTELYTTDILDKEYFWKEELMKVNDEFLFGCSTGMWGVGWGERKGIMELHAYSIMRAVEMDGHRLVLLKNPWGKGEWKGAWSDGSKEWTAEWLLKLNHRFGDDGNFWISYDDLLRKYQAFDRTRLFGPDWRVTALWTTLSVPWTLDYHDTYFAFTLTKTGPVVLVLSQLDDRYYRGLEGQYRFELNFRLHKDGQEDYVVRSISPYCQTRSVNVELELEAGAYTVLLKINATRNMDIEPIEAVVRNHARDRRDKLVAVGMSYDLAHSKGKVIETPEERQARRDADRRRRDREKEELRKDIMEARRDRHYLGVKARKKQLAAKAKAKARAKARREAYEAARAEKAQARREARRKREEELARDEDKCSDTVKDEKEKETEKHVQILSPRSTPPPDDATKKDPASDTSTDPSIKTPSIESEKSPADVSEPKPEDEVPEQSKPDSESDSRKTEVDNDEATAATAASSTKEPPEDEVPGSPSAPPGSETGPSDPIPNPEDAAPSDDQQRPPSPPSPPPPEDDDHSSEDEIRLSSDDGGSITSVSEISDRALSIEFAARRASNGPPPPMSGRSGPPPGGPLPPHPPPEDGEDDEFERNPWNAVATVGLRVYYKVSEADRDSGAEIVKLRVVRPNPYAAATRKDGAGGDGEKDEGEGEGDGDGEDDGKDKEEGAEKDKDKDDQQKSSKGLDVDDSSKDATLEGDREQRKKSILSLLPLLPKEGN